VAEAAAAAAQKQATEAALQRDQIEVTLQQAVRSTPAF
jgi:hypothetical protein